MILVITLFFDSRQKEEGVMITADDASFGSEVVEASMSQPVIAVLYASWCEDSRRLLVETLPLIEEINKKIKFVGVEIEGRVRGTRFNPKTHDNFRVEAYPTVLLFINGTRVESLVCDGPAEAQKDYLEWLIKRAFR